MSATNRSLATILRALQSDVNEEDLDRILISATTLFTLLANPLNVTLLTSQLLSAPSIWQQPRNLRVIVRLMNVFGGAAQHILTRSNEGQHSKLLEPSNALSLDEWTAAVIKGTHDQIPIWRQLCVHVGLLHGAIGHQRSYGSSQQFSLDLAIVRAVNEYLDSGDVNQEFVCSSLAALLSYAFDLLPLICRAQLNADALLPVLCRTIFLSPDGLHCGYIFSTLDAGIIQQGESKFDWSPTSATYQNFQLFASGPIVANLGPLSRLLSFCLDNAKSLDALLLYADELSSFTRSLAVQWRQNKLSEIDTKEEFEILSLNAIRDTLPTLWRTLRSAMFLTVLTLGSVLGRAISDISLQRGHVLHLALQSLHILRDIAFVTIRTGFSESSQYSFAHLTAIDILAQFPTEAEAFLVSTLRNGPDTPANHPLDRCYDLFYLNTAEHLALPLSSEASESLLISVATPYLGLGGDSRLLDVFEAAHSVTLAVLACPQNTVLLRKHVHPYIATLFIAFPQALSSRQFRIAIKTLVRITSPPSTIAVEDPLLPSAILDLLDYRIPTASTLRLTEKHPSLSADQIEPPLTEQSSMLMAMLDSLPFLPIDQLQDWLPRIGESIQLLRQTDQAQVCRERFWSVLSSGEMDVERAALCVHWWGTNGGRELILGRQQGPARGDAALMSGALLLEDSKL